MSDDPNRQLRLACNVGHGLERTYVERYQHALAAILAIVEPHDQPTMGAPSSDGSGFGRGYTAGMKALAGAVINAMRTELLGPDGDGDA